MSAWYVIFWLSSGQTAAPQVWQESYYETETACYNAIAELNIHISSTNGSGDESAHFACIRGVLGRVTITPQQ